MFKSPKMSQVQNRIDKKVKNTERQKTRFSKELLANADLYKSALNKILTMHTNIYCSCFKKPENVETRKC